MARSEAGLDVRQLRDLIVRPVLEYLGLPGGEVAERLLLGTAAHESGGFRYIKQVGGPALSLWQIEPATARDAMARAPTKVLARLHDYPVYLPQVSGVDPAVHVVNLLPGNLYLGAAMARVVYYLKPFEMPPAAGTGELAAIWKEHWNTEDGAGRPEQFVAAYAEHVAPLYAAG